MGILLAAGFAALAASLLVPHPAVRRLPPADLSELRPQPPRDQVDAWPTQRRRATGWWLLALATGVGVATMVGGLTGVVAGTGATLLAGRWASRSQATRTPSSGRRLAADLPITADLLAACLTAGAPPEAAAEAVAGAVAGEIGAELRRVTAALRLGGEPETTWGSLAARDALAPLGRAFARAARSGASLSAILAEVAEDARRQRGIAAESAARRVGVYAAAPLGLCFLPAFVLLAIVPVVAGLVVTIAP